MIVARITDIRRNSKTPGSVLLDGYEEWFPLTSASFSLGFGPEKQASEDGKSGELSTAEKVSGATIGKTKASSKGPANSVTCNKFVDAATSALMYLSVVDKLKVKGDPAAQVAADIHFLEVAGQSSQGSKDNISTKAFMKVALEEVTVTSWSLSGDGDDRPTEDFTLNFDKFAIQYIQLDDDGNFRPTNPRGFSQRDLDVWIPSKWKGKKL